MVKISPKVNDITMSRQPRNLLQTQQLCVIITHEVEMDNIRLSEREVIL